MLGVLDVLFPPLFPELPVLLAELPLQPDVMNVPGVLVIFVALHPKRTGLDGPLIVGWYRNATIYRSEQESKDGEGSYRVEAAAKDIKCVPVLDRKKTIPRARKGKTGIGQSNIFYTRDSKGERLSLPWLKSFQRGIRATIAFCQASISAN